MITVEKNRFRKKLLPLSAIIPTLYSGGIAFATPPIFTDVTAQSGLTHHHFGPGSWQIAGLIQANMSGGASAVDYDGDGWTDLYFTILGAADILYRNQGDGTFVDVTEAAFGPDHLKDVFSNGSSWADIDNDGVRCKGFLDHLLVNFGSRGLRIGMG